jgi:hypothetical protein
VLAGEYLRAIGFYNNFTLFADALCPADGIEDNSGLGGRLEYRSAGVYEDLPACGFKPYFEVLHLIIFKRTD